MAVRSDDQRKDATGAARGDAAPEPDAEPVVTTPVEQDPSGSGATRSGGKRRAKRAKRGDDRAARKRNAKAAARAAKLVREVERAGSGGVDVDVDRILRAFPVGASQFQTGDPSIGNRIDLEYAQLALRRHEISSSPPLPKAVVGGKVRLRVSPATVLQGAIVAAIVLIVLTAIANWVVALILVPFALACLWLVGARGGRRGSGLLRGRALGAGAMAVTLAIVAAFAWPLVGVASDRAAERRALAFVGDGDAALAAGDVAAARTAVDAALREDASLADVQILRDRVVVAQVGGEQVAPVEPDPEVPAEPQNPDAGGGQSGTVEDPAALREVARRAFEEGNYAQAVIIGSRAQELDPTDDWNAFLVEAVRAAQAQQEQQDQGGGGG